MQTTPPDNTHPGSPHPGALRHYQRPAVECFGDFRRLTRVGTDPDGDGGIIFGADDGCNVIPTGACRVT
jgi:hypothetical protein